MIRYLIIAGGVVAVISAAYYLGAKNTRNAIEADAAKEAIRRMTTMEQNNAAFSSLTPYGKCIAFADQQQFPRSLCDELN